MITFDGTDGSGKSTQIRLLERRLASKGKEVVVCRDPGGDAIAEQIRDVLLDTKNKGMTYLTELLLFEAARAQLYEEVVLPALGQGKIVISDRGPDDSVVYQGIIRGLGEGVVKQLNELATKGAIQDLKIFLDVPVDVGLKRKTYEIRDRFDLEGVEFHKRVREAYLKVVEGDPKRWVVIDGSKKIEEVAERVWQVVKKRVTMK